MNMRELCSVNRDLRVRTDVDYDQFFHPNICHICKSTNQQNLIFCNRCDMIAYCSEEHKELHLPYHADICSLIICYISMDPYIWCASRMTNMWFDFQYKFMLKIQHALPRKLKLYEKQMFMFARSCIICHRRYDLLTCGTCLSVNYCADHVRRVSDHKDSEICFKLALSVNLDIIFLELTAWESLYIKFIGFPDNKPLTDNRSFCNQYCRKRGRNQNWEFNKYAFSDYVSDPLTLYNGLKSAELFHPMNLMNTFIIHIIAANYVDRRNFQAWELFLHFLHEGTKLMIVMIGPDSRYETKEHKVCSCCKAANKRLILQSFPLLYHNYMHNIHYRRPNVIVGFQANLTDQLTWSQSIKAVQDQNCPLLLTTTLLMYANEYSAIIQDVLGSAVKPDFEFYNDFKSIRPYRDVESIISFRNTYLMIYKNLNVSSDQIQASTSTYS